MSGKFILADKACDSRLIIGTARYPNQDVMLKAVEASGAEIANVSIRRVSVHGGGESVYELLRGRCEILPNTAGCYTAEEAIRTSRLAREAGISDLVKLEVIGCRDTLFPDNPQLLKATEVLAKEGFVVMPYTNDDPVVCRQLVEAGAACVMPLGAPIGSGLGVRNPYNIRIILEQATVPVIVDAGVGTASDASIAMELGCDAVLMNTAIAGARDPIGMARAMKLAIESGRLAYLAGRIPRKLYASASSPLEGLIE